MGPVRDPMAGLQPFPSVQIVPRPWASEGAGKPGNHRGPGPLWTRYIRKWTAGGVSEDRHAPVPGVAHPNPLAFPAPADRREMRTRSGRSQRRDMGLMRAGRAKR